MIMQDYTQEKKILDLGWSALPHPDLVASDVHFFFHSLQNALNDKIFSRSGENICGKLLELETS